MQPQGAGNGAAEVAATGVKTRLAAALAATAAMFAAIPASTGQDLFRIGMVATEGEPSIAGLSAIRNGFSRALGMAVEVFVARDYAALIEAQASGRLDYAVYSTAAYAAASLRCNCIRPVAAPVAANGSIGFSSVLIMRKGIKAGTIAIGPADSMATRLAPLALWPAATAASAEGRLVSTDSASAALALFVDGAVDGFFGWVPAWPDETPTIVDRLAGSPARLQLAGLETGAYEITWRSPLLRYGPHAVRTGLSQEQLAKLARLLTRAADDDPEFAFYLGRLHGGGFVQAEADHYAAAIEALAALDGSN